MTNLIAALEAADWLEDRAMAIKSPVTELPLWRSFLWALFHPCKFAEHRGAFFALVNAAAALRAGEASQETPDAG